MDFKHYLAIFASIVFTGIALEFLNSWFNNNLSDFEQINSSYQVVRYYSLIFIIAFSTVALKSKFKWYFSYSIITLMVLFIYLAMVLIFVIIK